MNRLKSCRYGLMLFPDNDIYVGGSLEAYGEFSEAEVDLFRQLVKPGDTVLDIGANLGPHTIPLAQLVGPNGCVHAFEPQRTIYYLLCANVVLNNLQNVVCHQAGAADTTQGLLVPELDYAARANFGGLELEGVPSGRAYRVPTLRIDELQLQRCDFMKIDVEGMEKRVLGGAVETIRAFRPALYVEDDRFAKSQELRAFLDALGYEIQEHRPPLYNPHNLASNPQNIFGNIISLNLLCRHRDAAERSNGQHGCHRQLFFDRVPEPTRKQKVRR